jgi:hypothetical protein
MCGFYREQPAPLPPAGHSARCAAASAAPSCLWPPSFQCLAWRSLLQCTAAVPHDRCIPRALAHCFTPMSATVGGTLLPSVTLPWLPAHSCRRRWCSQLAPPPLPRRLLLTAAAYSCLPAAPRPPAAAGWPRWARCTHRAGRRAGSRAEDEATKSPTASTTSRVYSTAASSKQPPQIRRPAPTNRAAPANRAAPTSAVSGA